MDYMRANIESVLVFCKAIDRVEAHSRAFAGGFILHRSPQILRSRRRHGRTKTPRVHGTEAPSSGNHTSPKNRIVRCLRPLSGQSLDDLHWPPAPASAAWDPLLRTCVRIDAAAWSPHYLPLWNGQGDEDRPDALVSGSRFDPV